MALPKIGKIWKMIKSSYHNIYLAVKQICSKALSLAEKSCWNLLISYLLTYLL